MTDKPVNAPANAYTMLRMPAGRGAAPAVPPVRFDPAELPDLSSPSAPAVRVASSRIDQLLAEDVPYIDLTTEVLGIGAKNGTLAYFTRESCVLAGSEVVSRMADELGLREVDAVASGTRVAAGAKIATFEGPASRLHQLWKVGLNTLDHLSGVATRTRAMVDAAHDENPRCEILTTRKSLPGAKDLLTMAVMAGGAYPHRLGLSETVLVFGNHLAFLGGVDGLLALMPQIRPRCIEKKLFVEAGAEDALKLARYSAGHPHARIDGIQFDKIPAAEMTELVQELRAIDPALTLIAAGGINPANVRAYAATGVDGLATTAPFSAKPIDMGARMEPA